MNHRRWRQLGRHARPGPRVALFPFLAVLICTMGALVPLLLAMARQARLNAQSEAEARAAERIADLNSRREAVQWRIEQLRAARQRTEEQWRQAQQYLGHLEDHSRRLAEQIERLRRDREQFERKSPSDEADADSLREQLRLLDLEIARAEAEGLRPKPQSPPRRSYAVVPFVGPNRTQRRPIYLECTATAVIVQPEGIRLTIEDFQGPLGSSNPLVSVLRAAREQMVASGAIDPDRDGEPYPLLLVRPDGVAAYHHARLALKPWGPDFGYELLPAEMSLAYPPTDPQLSAVMTTALAQARQIQARLIAAAPRSYGRLRTSARSVESQTSEEIGSAFARGDAGAAGRPLGFPSEHATDGAPRQVEPGMAAAAVSQNVDPALGSTVGNINGAPGISGDADSRRLLEPDAAASSGVFAPVDRTREGGEPGSIAGRTAMGNRAGENILRTGSPQRPDHENRNSDAATLLPGQWYERPPRAELADSVRLKDRPGWKGLEPSPRSTGIVRPIRVELYPEKMIVKRGPDAVTIDLRLGVAAADRLAAVLRNEIQSWGIAGASAHWQPVLVAEVAPGAEARYAELERLLEGSGVELRRELAARNDSARPAPR